MIIVAKYFIFFGVYCVLTPLLIRIYFRIFKKTSSPIPFVGSVLIIIGNSILIFSGEFQWFYVLTILLIPFDSGIRFILGDLKGKPKGSKAQDKD